MADLKNEFSWSKSRAQCFEECPRQYWFRYYGSWGGWSPRADARTRAIYVLKQLQSRQMWVGDTVHKCLKWVLDTLRRTGEAPSEEVALRNTMKRLDVDFQNSGEGLYWDKPKDSCALIEHEYDELDVSEEVWKETFEKAAHCIHVFYGSDTFAEIRRLSKDQWLELEDLASVDVDGIKVWVQLDFARRDGDGARIYDWKTGRADQPATRDQLAVYALYGSGRWKLPPEGIACGELNLNTGELFQHRLEPGDIETARSRVAESAAAMRALLDDAEGNVASEDRFALTDNERLCRRCGFRRVCPRFAGGAEDPS